jgi:hypothetical protein
LVRVFSKVVFINLKGDFKMKELTALEQQTIGGGDGPFQGPPQSWIDQQQRTALQLLEELKRRQEEERRTNQNN